LLEEFGSVEQLKGASLERLQGIKGLSEKAALNLYTALHQDPSEPDRKVPVPGSKRKIPEQS
jgi:ERCC4-type nuclease